MFNNIEIGTLAGIITSLGFVPYIIETLKKRIKPSLVTWFIWSVIGISSYVSYVEINGKDSSIWVPMSYMLGPILITILCLRKIDKTYNKLDIVCFILSSVSLIISFIFNQFYFSLIVNIFADFLGVIPTIKKSYDDPYSESLKAWILFLIGNLMNIYILSYPFSFQHIYPFYLALISILIVAVIFYRRFKKFN